VCEVITLQEAERLLEAAQVKGTNASDFLTVLVSAGAFRALDAAAVTRDLMQEGVTQSAAAYTVRVLRKLGVVA
jgi:hypothetical protein